MKVFMSFRRGDALDIAGRLYDHLTSYLGRSSVVSDVPLAHDPAFRQLIETAVAECDVLLALIGPRWLVTTDEHGRRRLDDPYDDVRIELEVALLRDVPVLPILIGGARMPRYGDLPSSLQVLAAHNSLPLRADADFEHDVTNILKLLQRYPSSTGKRPRQPQTHTHASGAAQSPASVPKSGVLLAPALGPV